MHPAHREVKTHLCNPHLTLLITAPHRDLLRPLRRTRKATFYQQRFTTYYSNYLNRTKKTRQEMFRYSVNCFPENALSFVTLQKERGKSLRTQVSASLISPKYLSQPASSPFLIKGMVYSTGF